MDAFAQFLQAKYALDQRSLNPAVWRHFLNELSGRNPLELLDVGTGTGAMLRRILQHSDRSAMRLTGLDIESGLLGIAETEIATVLRDKGFAVEKAAGLLSAERGADRIEFQCICTPLSEFQPASNRYDVITAHAFMDLVPLLQTLSCFHAGLKPGGLFYATINYDGETVVFPPYPDSEFEDALLQTYDASMEARRLNGSETGGAKCGRRLYGELLNAGFEIVSYGGSDWNITPEDGTYRDDDQAVLERLLGWIYSEGRRDSAIAREKLDRWLECRRQQRQERTLGIIVHQIDILARKRD
ncbi:class I SAM-dependent methyltransferase [Methylotuvimicrobium buryatense]|uniref:Class I SAM-dependent methyltransferase n=1 Tax=Methylotuvimicrobium buryatense TaxID=95641 RepID=A0A4P9UJV0_METBY|nr:class I SAM-dependent methyltransferase [Methylotuvimicrobium buryatense]QCW81424.1 class I SAM-dependent methyltransferase [Methylotuvimicrobium buryatense]